MEMGADTSHCYRAFSGSQEFGTKARRLYSLLALRGHRKLSPSNGNFLKSEFMAQFDPIMQEHISHVQKGTSLAMSKKGPPVAPATLVATYKTN